MEHRAELATQVREFYATLGPATRREVKRALRQLAAGNGDTHALHDELEGYHRLRVGSYRIIYRHAAGQRILCDFMEHRRLVYEVFGTRLREQLGG